MNAVWVTMEALLRDNVDTVRHADGSLDMIVLLGHDWVIVEDHFSNLTLFFGVLEALNPKP